MTRPAAWRRGAEAQRGLEELEHRAVPEDGLVLGRDILTGDLSAVRPTGPIGEALLDQRQVAGIGNVWRCEALWHARVSPWEPAAEVDVPAVLAHTRRLMSIALEGGRPERRVYRRAGRPCLRCGTAIRSRGQGDDNRTAYWCPGCQEGGTPPGE